jgi:hypothetical protein
LGKRTICPHAGHAYSLTPRCRSEVRHFGHGIGWEFTQAANSSCERRSLSGAGASPAVAGEVVGGGIDRGAGDPATAPVAVVPDRIDERRPQLGHTARLAVPVDWSGTRQLGQRVFRPAEVITGPGALGSRGVAAGAVGAAGGLGAAGWSGSGRAHRTVRRPGS